MHQRINFGGDRSNCCRDMAVFHFFKWRPSAILNFKKFEILSADPIRRANVRHHAKFCADRSDRCGDMAIYRFFKMTAVRHLGFVLRVFGSPTKLVGGLDCCEKFGCNRLCSFQDMRFSIFWAKGLKMPRPRHALCWGCF